MGTLRRHPQGRRAQPDQHCNYQSLSGGALYLRIIGPVAKIRYARDPNGIMAITKGASRCEAVFHG